MYEASKKNYDISRDQLMAEMIAEISATHASKAILLLTMDIYL